MAISALLLRSVTRLGDSTFSLLPVYRSALTGETMMSKVDTSVSGKILATLTTRPFCSSSTSTKHDENGTTEGIKNEEVNENSEEAQAKSSILSVSEIAKRLAEANAVHINDLSKRGIKNGGTYYWLNLDKTTVVTKKITFSLQKKKDGGN